MNGPKREDKHLEVWKHCESPEVITQMRRVNRIRFKSFKGTFVPY